MTIRYSDLGEIDGVAQEVIQACKGYNIWLFEGQMGAGKTSLIKSICAQMNVVDNVSSPTFSLLNVYQTDTGDELFHFDFYRIEDQIEAIDIGCDEYFYSDNICFIEWPEKIPSLIPDRFVKISINLVIENEREISITEHE
ncbi:tRNA (adenosine(37)-N6)-threonylcarbamoyltransferase complex ATPase subunit type 1 TsaE [Reichenbachiella sp. MALMAid0571]|uniref:tRNA (adenosine(37)-N6)-threonylcarbamoyltransferase complex ATPase subunit type 1 TsaE n=1 Tax=Reichenbachiella sp. MALMAid0571 TaxID=3143939 RepID=UPI0032E034A9